MRILVCDDEAEVLNSEAEILKKLFSDKVKSAEIVKTTDPSEVMRGKESFDMAFLDIEMDGISGLELAEAVLAKNPDCFVFFVTNYSNYLDDAFDVRAFRYITKPMDEARLSDSIDKALLKIKDSRKILYVNAMGHREVAIKMGSILYIENKNRHTRIVTSNGEIMVEEPFSAVKALIEKEAETFVLTHQSYFVNVKYVSGYNNKMVTVGSKGKEYEVYMSRRRVKSFEDKMFEEAQRQLW